MTISEVPIALNLNAFESKDHHLSRESGEEDQSAAGLLLRTHSAGPVSQTCLMIYRQELLRTVILDYSTPQWRISELRVWSYEPFIVPTSSLSG